MLFGIVNRIEEQSGKKIEDMTFEEIRNFRFGTPILFMSSETKQILASRDFGDELVCVKLDETKAITKFKKSHVREHYVCYVLV